ncbi:MAG: ABC transporter ATP-binding protein [Bacillota bacterium]|nr:ABC transporter ATP-binding protein [Bacillota bacterium]
MGAAISVTPSASVALEVSGLHKVFPGKRPVHAVTDVTFCVPAGDVIGLLGPNGAGKTTIIKCVLGLVRATSGVTRVFGAETSNHPGRVLSSAAAVLEGARNTYWRLTVWENVCFFASLHGVSARDPAHRRYFEGLLARFGLEGRLKTPVRELSTGLKQKVAVVSALARRTPLVFLDEPTLGLDVETAYELRRLLPELARDEGRTLVISSHDMHVVQAVCRRVVIMSGGRVIADDEVANLLALFRSRRYRLSMPGALPGDAVAGVRSLDAAARIEVEDGVTKLELQLPAAAALYRLMDLLRDAGVVVETIVQSEPDLEHAFLELVRRERERQ